MQRTIYIKIAFAWHYYGKAKQFHLYLYQKANVFWLEYRIMNLEKKYDNDQSLHDSKK